jgi:hypothetical protein
VVALGSSVCKACKNKLIDLTMHCYDNSKILQIVQDEIIETPKIERMNARQIEVDIIGINSFMFKSLL